MGVYSSAYLQHFRKSLLRPEDALFDEMFPEWIFNKQLVESTASLNQKEYYQGSTAPAANTRLLLNRR
jgi:hypothetical protein